MHLQATMMDNESENGRPLRPLLPAVRLKPANSHGPPNLSGALTRKAAQNRAACSACRQRKSRCTGTRPKCLSCTTRELECIYDTATKDETRVQALKRKLTQFRDNETICQQIFDILQTRSSAEADEVFRRIRGGADPGSILRLIRGGDLLLQLTLAPEARYRYEFPYRRAMPAFLLRQDNPYLKSLVYEFSLDPCTAPQNSLLPTDYQYIRHPDLYLKPYHAAEIYDPLLESVKPSEWTNVSSNDMQMRKLLGAYFLNEYQSLTCFHKDYFLEGMATGRSRFCSRLLVNAVLAVSALCYREIPNRYECWNPRTLGYQFLAEAKRLWELEAGRSRLTTIQAGVLLNIVHNMNCKDTIGWAYTKKAVDMALGMGLFNTETKVQSKRESDARDFTAWALFSFQSLHCSLLFEPTLIAEAPKVPLPDPATEPEWYGEVWLRYPSSHKPCPSLFGELFKARCEVRVIMNDIVARYFGRPGYIEDKAAPISDRSTINEVNFFHNRLCNWYQNLPESLSPKKIVLPSQLMLHLSYQNVLINIHEPFANMASDEYWSSPKQISEIARGHFETLVRLYYLRHGFEAADLFLIQPLSLLALKSVTNLGGSTHSGDLSSVRSTLILAAKGLYDQGRSFYVAQTALRLLRENMKPEDVKLLDQIPEVKDAQEMIDSIQAWEVQSRWAPGVMSITDNPDGQRINQLVVRHPYSDDLDTDYE
ncbi:hypothetical protein BX600DRAFT_138214 [Xylariales sp. PMI_506]|nr:hypothetical protein BX600DRAFT_138214 [Xylariales sp. PMI_506]